LSGLEVIKYKKDKTIGSSMQKDDVQFARGGAGYDQLSQAKPKCK